MCCGARVRIETGLSSARRPSDGAVRRKKTIRVHHPRGRPQGLLPPSPAHCRTPRGPRRRRARARLANAGSGRKRPGQACRRPRHAVPVRAFSPAPHLRHAPGPCPYPTLPHPRLHGRGPRAPASRPRRRAGACAGRAARPGSPAPAASAPPGRRPRPARAAPRAARRSAAPARRPRLAPEPAGGHAGRPRWQAAASVWFWLARARRAKKVHASQGSSSLPWRGNT